MPTRPFSQPSSDQWGLVRDVVVHDEMDVEFARHGGLDLVEELAELGGSAVEKAGYTGLAEGARISYELRAGRSGKTSAENLRIG